MVTHFFNGIPAKTSLKLCTLTCTRFKQRRGHKVEDHDVRSLHSVPDRWEVVKTSENQLKGHKGRPPFYNYVTILATITTLEEKNYSGIIFTPI